MTGDETLDAYIALSDDLCRATKTFVDGGVATLREMGYQLKIRDKVILALALKIDSAFRALIDDARLRRVETVHHLKTIIEAFIFMFVVAKDLTHVTAKRLLAEVCEQKEKYFRLNPDRDTPTAHHRADWDQALKDFAEAGILPIGAVGAAAVGHSSELAKWYDAAYRLACEPAHIADLFEFMPPPDFANIEVGRLRTGPLQALVAIDHGLLAMFHTVHLANANELGLTLDLAPFEERYRALDAARRTP
jgi:hypothetical protein